MLPALIIGSQIVHADDVGTGGLGFFSLGALGEHGHALGLAGAVGQHDSATHDLVGFLGIDAELHGHVDGLIELGVGEFFDDAQGIGQRVQLVAVDLACRRLFDFWSAWSFTTPSTVTPIERAEPAMVRTAASRSAAVMSFILVLAISSSWARVILPTLSVCGVAEPLSSLMAFLIRVDRRRRLDDEGKALVRESGDHHGQRQTGLNTLGLGVERLAELHDVQAALTQCRADGWGWIGLASWHLQLDKADDFFRHTFLLAGDNA